MQGAGIIIEGTRNGVALVRLSGELDMANVPRVEEAVDRCLEDGAASIALDLSGVTFIDSGGIHALIRTRKLTGDRGGQLYLVGATGELRRLFTLLGLDKLFTLCREEDLPGE
jgi:anti-sigma B factor antagonist